MDCCTGGRHCRRAFMIMMASAIAIAAVGSVMMAACDDVDAAGETSGTCGDDLTWTVDSDGNLSIEGTGPMYDFKPGDYRWGGNDIVTVTIGDSVTSIGEYAFWNGIHIVSAVIGDSVLSIGSCAFMECSALESVSMGKSVTSIGENVFWSCIFKSIDLPDTLESIGGAAFFECGSLESVAIPDSATEIGFAPFDRCTSLKSITVGSGNPAYSSSDGVLFDKEKTRLIQYPAGKEDRSYSIPDSVRSIGIDAFNKSGNLEHVSIPGSVASIGLRAFANCGSLASVTIPDSVTEIEGGAFMDCHGLLKIGFGNGVTSMRSAFRGHVFYDSDGTTVLGSDASNYAGSYFIGASEDKMVRSDWPSVTVTFDANGGQCSVGSVKTENGRMASIPVPTREGFTFDGWSSSASGGAGVTGSTLFIEDATVYAQWKEDSGSGKGLGSAAYAAIAVVIVLAIAGAVLYRKTM